MIRYLFFALTFSTTAVLAQDNDNKAAEILERASKTNASYENIGIDFSYTLENKAADMNDTRDGSLTLMGERFKLVLMGQEIYSDGSIVWYDMKDAQEVHVKTMDEFRSETDIDPSNLFEQYQEGFKMKYHGEEKVNGKTADVVDLFPEVPDEKPYSRVRLAIDRSTDHILYSKTFGKDGTNYLLEVNDMKTDRSLDASVFSFNEKVFEDAGYDVVDFR